MSQFLDPSDPEAAKIVQTIIGKRIVIQEATHGHDSHIVITDDHRVYRFPRHQLALHRTRLEASVLEYLADKISSVAIPRFGQVISTPVYHVSYPYIEGRTINETLLQQLPEATLISLGTSLGAFIAELQTAISATTFRELQHATLSADERAQTAPWDDYLTRAIADNTTDTLPRELLEVAQRELASLKALYPDGFEGNAVVHDDLYAHNLILNDSNELVGVIDFADIGLGDMARELRQSWRTSLDLFESAAEEYRRRTGETILLESVQLWAKVMEWAALLQNWGNVAPHRRTRDDLARHNLTRWYPELSKYLKVK